MRSFIQKHTPFRAIRRFGVLFLFYLIVFLVLERLVDADIDISRAFTNAILLLILSVLIEIAGEKREERKLNDAREEEKLQLQREIRDELRKTRELLENTLSQQQEVEETGDDPESDS